VAGSFNTNNLDGKNNTFSKKASPKSMFFCFYTCYLNPLSNKSFRLSFAIQEKYLNLENYVKESNCIIRILVGDLLLFRTECSKNKFQYINA
jgi:hypothetical protein